MATKNNNETNQCTIKWEIANISHLSHCSLKSNGGISSPVFVADALEGTKWSLLLYPVARNLWREEMSVSVFLRRESCSGPHELEVSYQAAFLDKNGKFLAGGYVDSIKGGSKVGNGTSVDRGRVFVTEREAFLPEDTLTVQCTLWKKGETLLKSKQISARTVLKVNRQYFFWKIDEFSKVIPGVRTKYRDDLIDFDLVLNEGIDFVKKLDVEIISFKEQTKMFSIKISIMNSAGENEECGKFVFLSGDLERGILPVPQFSKMLLENKTRYLPNDELLLNCEYVSHDGTVLCEFCCDGCIISKLTKRLQTETPLEMAVLVNDLKAAYNDEIHSDTELRTSTKRFPAHKFILSARSPVFGRMFSNDMKEKNSGHVDIADLEDDTLQRMLLYVYTDTLEDLKLENAYKLYAAADKYEIISLRNRCSSFLKGNLIPSKACDLMVLADRHHDDDMKNTVQDYILKHDQEVFGSKEWKQFMDTSPKLAAYIMFRKFFPH